eukprot:1884748-Rhodomonas_salina.1
MIGGPVRIHHPKQEGEEGPGYTDYQAWDQGQGKHGGPRMELAWVNPAGQGELTHLNLVRAMGTPSQD